MASLPIDGADTALVAVLGAVLRDAAGVSTLHADVNTANAATIIANFMAPTVALTCGFAFLSMLPNSLVIAGEL